MTTTSLSADTRPMVREAEPRDHPRIRLLLNESTAQYRAVLPSRMYHAYLDDLLDLDRHARDGHLLVATRETQIVGSASFYADATVQHMGWPSGWSGGRGLAVHPAARRHGVAQALLGRCERLGRTVGSPMFAFHSATFMKEAVRLYGHLGYIRLPRYDTDLAAHYGAAGEAYLPVLAFGRDLTEAARHG